MRTWFTTVIWAFVVCDSHFTQLTLICTIRHSQPRINLSLWSRHRELAVYRYYILTSSSCSVCVSLHCTCHTFLSSRAFVCGSNLCMGWRPNLWGLHHGKLGRSWWSTKHSSLRTVSTTFAPILASVSLVTIRVSVGLTACWILAVTASSPFQEGYTVCVPSQPSITLIARCCATLSVLYATTPLAERLRVLACWSFSTHFPMVIGLDFMMPSSLSVHDSMPSGRPRLAILWSLLWVYDYV